jgi:hypothetical protein
MKDIALLPVRFLVWFITLSFAISIALDRDMWKRLSELSDEEYQDGEGI